MSRALKLIEGGALDRGDVASLADRLKIGERQLRRLFRQHIGATPVAVAQTRRVLLAKQLIHQTALSMIQVALASGFGSVRRFNETFQDLYHRPPSEFRRQGGDATSSSPDVSLLLPYRPPYDWDAMIQFLKVRAVEGVERVTNESYSRLIEIGTKTGWVTITHVPTQSALRVVVRFPELSALPQIITRIRRMFDLSADPNAIAAALSCDPTLAPLVAARPGLRLPGGWDGFEIAARAVLGQQITLKAATRLAAKITAAAGTRIDISIDRSGLTHAFPRPEQISAAVLVNLGIPASRATSLAALADAAAGDARLFDPRRNLEDAVAHLCKLPGVGEWTAQYIAMRALGETDAFLAGDVAIQRSMAASGHRPTASELLIRAESWRPWRAYAVLHLWTADAAIERNVKLKEMRHAVTA